MIREFFGFDRPVDSREIPAWRDSSPGYARKARLSSVLLAVVVGVLFYFFGDGGLTRSITPALVALLIGTCFYQAWERGSLREPARPCSGD